jgi:iron complex transport system substrate-binding protein
MAVVDTINYGRGSQIIYEYLGMKGPEKLQHNIETLEAANAQSISFEVLHDYAGDYIFRSSYDGMVDLSDHTIWNNIPAVKEGRLIEISFGLSYYNDIYSLDKQLDFIVESLLATQE